jgi:hypothetical protein
MDMSIELHASAGERAPGTRGIGSWVGFGPGLDSEEELGIETDSAVVQRGTDNLWSLLLLLL